MTYYMYFIQTLGIIRCTVTEILAKQGTNVAHNIMGGLQIIAMFHL